MYRLFAGLCTISKVRLVHLLDKYESLTFKRGTALFYRDHPDDAVELRRHSMEELHRLKHCDLVAHPHRIPLDDVQFGDDALCRRCHGHRPFRAFNIGHHGWDWDDLCGRHLGEPFRVRTVI